MSSVIQNLLDNTLGDGARSSKFECSILISPPSLYKDGKEITILTKTSQFPGKSHDVIDFKFKGRNIPLKGQTKYDNTWTCTFYLTQDHMLKKTFEDWIESLDQQHNYIEPSSTVDKAQKYNASVGYVTNMQITQLDFTAEQETAVYTLYNVFPKSVSGIDVDYSATGQILEFTVEFSYSNYDVKVEKVKDGTFVDELKSKANGVISDTVGSAQSQVTGVLTEARSDILESLNSITSEDNELSDMFSKVE
jgi:hypothetical protein